MKNQVPEKVKTERLMKLQALLLSQQKAFNQATIGKTFDVLLTEKGKEKGQLIGYSPYLQGTVVRAPQKMLGEIVKVKITSATATALKGEIVK